MAASTTAHPHFHLPAMSRERLTFGWPHRVAAGLLVLIGAGFVAVTLAANLFSVGPAFDRLTDDFRPFMTQKTLQADQQGVDGLAAANTEIQGSMMPALAQQLGMSPQQFQAMMAEQYPAVTAGLAAMPKVTPQFSGLLTTLDQQRPYFKAADAIPTSSIPSTSVPWSLFAVGLITAGFGVWVWFKPRGSAIAVTVVGAALIAIPLVLNMPHKASYADTLNDNLKPVYTESMVTQANASLTTLGAMGTEMQQKMLPDMATQLKMTPDEPSSRWNGGLAITAWKLPDEGRVSFRCAASWRVREAAGNRPSSRAERCGAISLSSSVAPHASAMIAISPVPADGSSTLSPGRTWAASTAKAAKAGGVENWSSATCSSLRRVWVKVRSVTLASKAAISAGASSSRLICGLSRRSCRTRAASMAS